MYSIKISASQCNQGNQEKIVFCKNNIKNLISDLAETDFDVGVFDNKIDQHTPNIEYSIGELYANKLQRYEKTNPFIIIDYHSVCLQKNKCRCCC